MKKAVLFLSMASMLLIAACGGGKSQGAPEQEIAHNIVQPYNDSNPQVIQIADEDSNEIQTANVGGKLAKSGKKKIVLSMAYKNEYYEKAKKKFEAKHPDIEIILNYEWKKGDSDPLGAQEKYLKKMNSAFLAGKGPDLVDTDYLPMHKYAGKKLLSNLLQIMANDPTFKKGDYFFNVLGNLNSDGSIYKMPLFFQIEGLIGNGEALGKAGVDFDDKSWNWDQFIHTLKELRKNGNPSYIPFYGVSDESTFFLYLFTSRITEFVDEVNRNASIDSASFIDLLKKTKTLFKEGLVSESLPNNSSGGFYFQSALFETPQSFFGRSKGYGYTLKSPKLYFQPMLDGEHPSHAFRTVGGIGINERSPVKREAWEFIKFLLSEEMQSPLAKGQGFPLNKKALDNQMNQMAKEGAKENGNVYRVSQADIQLLKQFVADAGRSGNWGSSEITSMVYEGTKPFFSGQKSAEAIAKLIQGKATLFLNE